MESRAAFLQSKRLSACGGIALVIAFGSFACAHLEAFRRTHEWMLLLFCFSEMIIAACVLVRSAPASVSGDWLDWVAGIGGTWAPLLLRPAPWGLFPFARYAIVAGLVIQIAGLLSLNRSFAVVAAKREIKTDGMYRFIRHPVYAAYFLTFSGYVLMNTSMPNLLAYLVTMALLLVRMVREERHLALDERYRRYMQTVTYRVIPYVF